MDKNTSLHDRLPPHNIEAEMAVLGSILIDSATLEPVRLLIPRAEFFYDERNGVLYEAVVKLSTERSPIDFVTLINYLNERGLTEKVGGEGRVG